MTIQKMLFFLFICSIFPLLTSCAFTEGKPKKVILRHPVTYDYVDCDVDIWQTEESYKKNDKCVENYKKQGFVVWETR